MAFINNAPALYHSQWHWSYFETDTQTGPEFNIPNSISTTLFNDFCFCLRFFFISHSICCLPFDRLPVWLLRLQHFDCIYYVILCVAYQIGDLLRRLLIWSKWIYKFFGQTIATIVGRKMIISWRRWFVVVELVAGWLAGWLARNNEGESIFVIRKRFPLAMLRPADSTWKAIIIETMTSLIRRFEYPGAMRLSTSSRQIIDIGKGICLRFGTVDDNRPKYPIGMAWREREKKFVIKHLIESIDWTNRRYLIWFEFMRRRISSSSWTKFMFMMMKMNT